MLGDLLPEGIVSHAVWFLPASFEQGRYAGLRLKLQSRAIQKNHREEFVPLPELDGLPLRVSKNPLMAIPGRVGFRMAERSVAESN